MKPLDQQTDEELIATLGRAAALPDAPAAAIQRAVGLFAQREPGWGELAGRLLRAVLSFDSWTTGPLASGLRSGAAPSPTRQLVFSAEGRDVDLRIEPATALFRISGQVLGPDERGQVELQRGPADAVHRATIDALGEFHFEPVGPGVYRVCLRLPDATVELPPVEVGARRG